MIMNKLTYIWFPGFVFIMTPEEGNFVEEAVGCKYQGFAAREWPLC